MAKRSKVTRGSARTTNRLRKRTNASRTIHNVPAFDALVVTALGEELKATLGVFREAASGPIRILQVNGAKINVFRLAITSGPYKDRALTVGIASDNQMAGEKMAAYSSGLFSTLKPRVAILCGIAASVDPTRAGIGDVAVAEEVYSYSNISIQNHELIPRIAAYSVSEELRGAANSIETNEIAEWQKRCVADTHRALRLMNETRRKSQSTRWPSTKVLNRLGMDELKPTMLGSIGAAGPFLVRDEGFRNSLIGEGKDATIKLSAPVHPKLVWVEMEGGGFMAGCKKHRVDGIVIKGISDLGDENKSDLERATKGFFRIFAATNSAVTALMVLQVGPFVPFSIDERNSNRQRPAGLIARGRGSSHAPAPRNRARASTTAPDSITNAQNVISLEVDPQVAERTLHPVIHGWHQRSLYLGREGALAWLNVSRSQAASIADKQTLRQQLNRMIENISVKTYISLGPGDAEMDFELVANLGANRGKRITYVPVDVSDYLLQHAVTRLSSRATVPVGILGDFEEGMDFIKTRINPHIQHPFLIALTGNTFGNLDRYEKTLLHDLEKWMTPQDYLLIDADRTGEVVSQQQDSRYDNAADSIAFRHFHAAGVARQAEVSIQTVLNEYNEAVVSEKGTSDVPGTDAVDIYYAPKRVKISSYRRYEWDLLLKWIKDTFDFTIKREASFVFAGAPQRGRGAMLLQKVG